MADEPAKTGNARAGNRDGWHAPLPERVPNATAWPMVVAFGATLLAWGIVASWIFSVVGGVTFLVGMGGWIQEMRNDQQS